MLRLVSPVLLVPHLRLAWVLGVLWWATGTKQPATVIAAPSVSTVVQVGSAHHAPPQSAALIEQIARNREAVAPSGPDVGFGLQAALALLPVGCAFWLIRLLAAQLPLPVRPCAVPDMFRRRLLGAALAPNAP